MVFAEGDRDDGMLGYFIFRFVDREGQKKYNKSRKRPIGIIVYVKEKFTWDRSNLAVGERERWTLADANKYGNLTVADISVSGEELLQQ